MAAPLGLGFGGRILVSQVRLFDFLGPQFAAFDTFADLARLRDVVGLPLLVLRVRVLVVHLVRGRIHQNCLFGDRGMFGQGRFTIRRRPILKRRQVTRWPHPSRDVVVALLLGKVIEQKLLQVDVPG